MKSMAGWFIAVCFIAVWFIAVWFISVATGICIQVNTVRCEKRKHYVPDSAKPHVARVNTSSIKLILSAHRD